jgi:transposase-like protein
MNTHEFKRLMGLLDRLSSEQRSQLALRLQSGGGERAVTQMIESRMEARPCCPHCTSTQVVRNGHADGQQRYKCRVYGKSFNALS